MEVVLGKKNPVLWHHYSKGELLENQQRMNTTSEHSGEREWFIDFFFFSFFSFTSKIKPRGGVGPRQKEGRNRSEIADLVMNENERIQEAYQPRPSAPHTPVLCESEKVGAFRSIKIASGLPWKSVLKF